MAAPYRVHAKEDRRSALRRAGEGIDILFFIILLVIFLVGLCLLYSASYAQSEYDTGYTDSTRYLMKQGACGVIGLLAMFFLSRIPVL